MDHLYGKQIFLTKKRSLATLKDTGGDFIKRVQIIEECPVEYAPRPFTMEILESIILRPGRVVTLLSSPNPDEEVWGIAYKISSTHVDSVVKHLDFREKGGYMRKTVVFYTRNTGESISPKCIEESNSRNAQSNTNPSLSMTLDAQNQDSFYITIYIGEPDNPNYAGAEDIPTIANHIFLSHGSSGSNIEYLYKLASAMRAIAPGVHDEHLYTLEAAVKELERGKSKEMQNVDKN